MCELFISYVFQTQENKGIIKRTGHRKTSCELLSKDQMSRKYKHSIHAHVHRECEEEKGI
jgi:hypothetical protein